jgi:hypothetical protein
MKNAVRICCTEGPIILHNAPATGIQASYPLWNGASASEFFPPGVSSGYYILTLEKSVTHAREVQPVEEELTHALLLIAAAWSFSGGSYMLIESRAAISSPRIKSNADEIERELLGSGDITAQVQEAPVLVDSLVCYSHPPLAHAIKIARTMQSDYITGQLLKYFHTAWVNRPHVDEASWFVNLYKVRDLLQIFYCGEKPARTTLSIRKTEWKHFGVLLNNNDLRHAEITGRAPSVSPVAIEDAYATARRWVTAYLKTKGLTIPEINV